MCPQSAGYAVAIAWSPQFPIIPSRPPSAAGARKGRSALRSEANDPSPDSPVVRRSSTGSAALITS